MIIEGKNAVHEALHSEMTVEKLMVQKDSSHYFSNIINLCRDKKIIVQFVDKLALDRVSPTKRHQGILAIATDFEYTDFDFFLAQGTAPKLVVLLDGLEDPHNVGAIVRVVDCAGASGIVIPRHRCCGITDTVIKISSGACSHVKIAKVGNINDAIRQLKENNFTVFATDMIAPSVYNTNLKGDIAIVIGSESKGVSKLTKELCDGIISIPQFGKINSLNASVATGIVLYEAVRQRNNL